MRFEEAYTGWQGKRLTRLIDNRSRNQYKRRNHQNPVQIVAPAEEHRHEMAYVAMPEAAAELLFQIIAGRAERAAVIVTTNLPFSEWTTMFPNARLCKAMLDRLTDQAHIIETGTESYRFRRTLSKKKGGKG